MSEPAAGVLLGIIIVFVDVVTLLAFHERGYQRGLKDGSAEAYQRGRKEADDWWISVERGADQARQQIWKEEPKS